jgi:hypothetical protein
MHSLLGMMMMRCANQRQKRFDAVDEGVTILRLLMQLLRYKSYVLFGKGSSKAGKSSK